MAVQNYGTNGHAHVSLDGAALNDSSSSDPYIDGASNFSQGSDPPSNFPSPFPSPDETIGLLTSRTELFVRPPPWIELLDALRPFSAEEWQEASWYNKIYLLMSVSRRCYSDCRP